MLIERAIIGVISLVTLAAIALLQENQCQTAVVVSLLVTPLSLGYILSTKAQIKKFTYSTLGKKTSHLSIALPLTEEKIKGFQHSIAQIISAIEKIGDKNQNLNSIVIYGEAGKAIVALQNKLITVKEEEEQRVWAAQGIAHMSEIRKDNASLEDYGFQIISHLTKFLGANQGAFYYKNEIDEKHPHLELLATYAYGKRKHSVEKITLEYGAGLVGQCALEGSMILMTDVPHDYIKITSGLGEALPRCITLTPLIFRDEVFGVIEIASFQKFTPHQLEFIKKSCETIGLELSGIRAQERTRKLLEQSREEELRQNLEEMKATQREMLIKEEELNKQLVSTQRAKAMADAERRKNEAILEGCMDAVISFNQHSKVVYVNQAAEEVFGVSRENAIGQSVDNLLKIHIVETDDEGLKIISATGNEVSLRTEVNAIDSTGEVISLLLTATKVKIDGNYLFTLFAQKVSVELF